MEKIYATNSLKHLSSILAENLRQSEGGPFARTVLVTQSAGMNAWLRTELARQNRVFAHFEFLNQDGLFASIYKLLFGERLQNSQDTVRYRIYDLLGHEDFLSQFEKVAAYFKESDLRRFQLASRIADLFDQYQIYRPEMIEKWKQGSQYTKNDSEKWQQWLWLQLELEPKAGIKERLLEEMKNKSGLIKEEYPHISLFGISIYTQFHLDFIRALAQHTRVDFYLSLPTREIEFKNELLVSFGVKAGELAGMFDDINFVPQESGSNTLLGKIQDQILKNSPGVTMIEDDSIQVNSCHTPAREVECVYNYLLDLFDRDPALGPADVLIMTSDISKYAPLVKAVFRNAPVSLPFRISGVARKDEGSMVAALDQILRISRDDLGAETVVSLLEHKRIKQRFGIEDTTYVRSLVRKANIRFGYENRTSDDTHYVSWSYGLQKFLLGYAMLTDEEVPVDNDITLQPYRDAEARQSHDLLRLKAFVDALVSVIEAMDELKSVSEWKSFLFGEVLEKMVNRDDFSKDDSDELSSIYRTLSFLDELGQPGEIPFRVFLEELNTRLFSETRDFMIATGNITVSSPVPVRGLPFKVICFLGLDNGVFPRQDRFLGFDLLGEAYIPGDRSVRETDKYLFLDTLMAAREKLYLSFVGQSVKNNDEIPPSIVLDTLMNFLDQYVVGNKILVRHPLHGFSARYQEKDPRLFTYLHGGNSRGFQTIEAIQEEYSEVLIKSFVSFFEHPIKWYFKEVLGIWYGEEEEALPEFEMFEMNGLEEWVVKNDLINIQTDDYGDYLRRGIRDGKLPLKTLGDIQLGVLNERISELKSALSGILSEKEERSVYIDLKMEGLRIHGDVSGVYDRQYVAYAFSDKLKYKLAANLYAIMLYAAGEIDSAVFYALKKRTEGPYELITENLPAMSSEAAINRIVELADFFRKGLLSPLRVTVGALHKTIQKNEVENIFKSDVDGIRNVMPADKYVKYLYDNNLLDDFTIEPFDKDNFDEKVYDGPVFEQINTLAVLLNLKPQ